MLCAINFKRARIGQNKFCLIDINASDPETGLHLRGLVFGDLLCSSKLIKFRTRSKLCYNHLPNLLFLYGGSTPNHDSLPASSGRPDCRGLFL